MEAAFATFFIAFLSNTHVNQQTTTQGPHLTGSTNAQWAWPQSNMHPQRPQQTTQLAPLGTPQYHTDSQGRLRQLRTDTVWPQGNQAQPASSDNTSAFRHFHSQGQPPVVAEAIDTFGPTDREFFKWGVNSQRAQDRTNAKIANIIGTVSTGLAIISAICTFTSFQKEKPNTFINYAMVTVAAGTIAHCSNLKETESLKSVHKFPHISSQGPNQQQ